MKTKQQTYQALNPDAFTRFFISKEILKRTFLGQAIMLLDVGGGSKYFRFALRQDQLPYQLTVIDILRPPAGRKGYTYIQGDATNMDFPDNSFEAVVSMDVLEHVSDTQKGQFLQECYRVAKDLVIIAAPFDSPTVTKAETIANDFFRSCHGRDHPWLIEHFQQNKPATGLIEKEIKHFGCPHLHFESNYLPTWLKLILLNFIPANLLNPDRVYKLNQFYNDHFLELDDFRSPGYRQFYVLYKNPHLKKGLDHYFTFPHPTGSQLVLEQKMSALFMAELAEGRALIDDHMKQQAISLTTITELMTQLEHADRHASNLQAALDRIYDSKTYKLSRKFSSLWRIITNKSRSR